MSLRIARQMTSHHLSCIPCMWRPHSHNNVLPQPKPWNVYIPSYWQT